MVTISGLNCAKECKRNFSNTTPVFASINFFWYELKLVSKDCLLSNGEVRGRFFCCTKQLSNLIKVQSIDPITWGKFLQYWYGVMEPCLIPILLCNVKPKTKVVTERNDDGSAESTGGLRYYVSVYAYQVHCRYNSYISFFISNDFFMLGWYVA